VPFLDAERYREVNPGLVPGGGSIRLLSKWNTELWDTGEALRRPGACSAHYFDFRDDGFVASTWFEQGLRILDVRDPGKIRQVGYFLVPDQFTWDAYWVPGYSPDGRQTDARSDLIYTADNARGLDIVRVDLGGADQPDSDRPDRPHTPRVARRRSPPGEPAEPGMGLDLPDPGLSCEVLASDQAATMGNGDEPASRRSRAKCQVHTSRPETTIQVQAGRVLTPGIRVCRTTVEVGTVASFVG
jgi:hypothetical protein